MTSKKANRRKPKSGITIAVAKSGNSRAQRKAATAKVTMAAAANTAMLKKTTNAAAASAAAIKKAATPAKPVVVGKAGTKKVGARAVKK